MKQTSMRHKMKRKKLRVENFLGFDCFGGNIPDESSICRFRHLLEEHNLSQSILAYKPAANRLFILALWAQPKIMILMLSILCCMARKRPCSAIALTAKMTTKATASIRFHCAKRSVIVNIPPSAPRSSTRFEWLNICGSTINCVIKA